jgi:hypothetical protein
LVEGRTVDRPAGRNGEAVISKSETGPNVQTAEKASSGFPAGREAEGRSFAAAILASGLALDFGLFRLRIWATGGGWEGPPKAAFCMPTGRREMVEKFSDFFIFGP